MSRLSKLAFWLGNLLLLSALQQVLGLAPAHAGTTSARVVGALPDTGEEVRCGISNGTNAGNEETYEGGYLVMTCIDGNDLVIRPNASPANSKLITATCPTATPVIEEKSHNNGSFVLKYVVARCNPAGETLTTAATPDDPSMPLTGQYTYENDPANECPPNCGYPTPPPEDEGNPQAEAICDRRHEDQPGGTWTDEEVEECRREVAEQDADHPKFTEAVEFWCTLQVEGQPPGPDRQSAYDECVQEEMANAGFASQQEEFNDEECAIEAGAFAWILCPIVRLANAGFGKLNERAQELLKVDVLTKSESSDGLRAVWGVMRTLANISFVLIFLAIIFANTLSLNLDSYTVKRMLPRLVAATVLVQFSFLLSGIVIDIANVLGDGIKTLIEEAITTAIPDAFSVGGNPSSVEQFGGAILLFVIGGAFIAVVGLPFLLLLILSAFISIMGVFITLLLRQLVIAILIVISPLAFAAWVLPNTDAFFRFWWKNFFKTVMMYPLIVLILAMGSVVAAVVNLGEDNTPSQFAAAFFPVIAWFMIPATFKMVGGITGAVAGKVTGTASKAAGKTSSFAKKRYAPDMKGRLQTMAAGGGVKFAGKTWLGGQGSSKLGRGIGRTFGMAGTLSGPTRSQANFNQAQKRATKELEELGLDGVEASELILGGQKAMDRAKAEHAAGRISDADLARKQALFKQVRRYNGSTAHQAAAAKAIGGAGVASDDTRQDLVRTFGTTGPMGNIGEQIWRDAAFNSKETRGHLRFIDYQSGKVDAAGLAKDAAGRGEAYLARQSADSWAHILKASQLSGEGPSAATISAVTAPGANNSVSDAARAVIGSPAEIDNRTVARAADKGGPVTFI